MAQLFSADTNAFGHDPNGFKAHLAALIFGPGYLPDNDDQLPSGDGDGVKALAPRFGGPAPHQIRWLPEGWTPTEPPHFYGVPCPPYLPKPRRFNPDMFAALMPYARQSRTTFQEEPAMRKHLNVEIADRG
jgi:hypothetical protein